MEEAECKKNLKCLLMNLFFEKYRIYIKILALHEHWDMYKGVAKISKDFLKGRIEIFKCLTVHVLNWRRCKPLLHMEFWRSLPRRLRDWSTWYIRLALYDSMRLINPMYFCNKSVTNLTNKLQQRFSFPLINSLFSYYLN